MNKMFLFLSRMMLILGVLVALTPCAECRMDQMGPAAMGCHMPAKAGPMDCCHSHKAPNPFCRIMDQSSVSVPAAHLDAPAVPAAFHGFQVPQVVAALPASSAVPFSSSPPRGPLALRI